jgi:hypothetical protein
VTGTIAAGTVIGAVGTGAGLILWKRVSGQGLDAKQPAGVSFFAPAVPSVLDRSGALVPMFPVLGVRF